MRAAAQIPGCLPKGFSLDSLLTVAQFAVWRQIEPLTARRKLAETNGVIRSSQKDCVIHPRTYLEMTLKTTIKNSL